jgi:hypothetical protein
MVLFDSKVMSSCQSRFSSSGGSRIIQSIVDVDPVQHAVQAVDADQLVDEPLAQLGVLDYLGQLLVQKLVAIRQRISDSARAILTNAPVLWDVPRRSAPWLAW